MIKADINCCAYDCKFKDPNSYSCCCEDLEIRIDEYCEGGCYSFIEKPLTFEVRQKNKSSKVD